jgi:hypothetical protein
VVAKGETFDLYDPTKALKGSPLCRPPTVYKVTEVDRDLFCNVLYYSTRVERYRSLAD